MRDQMGVFNIYNIDDDCGQDLVRSPPAPSAPIFWVPIFHIADNSGILASVLLGSMYQQAMWPTWAALTRGLYAER